MKNLIAGWKPLEIGGKRNVVAALFDFLGGHEEVYQCDLLRLMAEVAAIENLGDPLSLKRPIVGED